METIECPKCGAKNTKLCEKNFSFCVECGEKIEYETIVSEENIVTEEPKKMKFFEAVKYYLGHMSEVSNGWEKTLFILAVIACPATILSALLSVTYIFKSLARMGIMLCIGVLIASIIQKNKHPEKKTLPLSIKLSLIGLIAGVAIRIIVAIIKGIILIITTISTIANAVTKGESILQSLIDLIKSLI